MKKRLERILLLIVTGFVFSFGLASCSNDDGNDSNDSSGNNGKTENTSDDNTVYTLVAKNETIIITAKADKTYTATVTEQGQTFTIEEGKYTVDGNKIIATVLKKLGESGQLETLSKSYTVIYNIGSNNVLTVASEGEIISDDTVMLIYVVNGAAQTETASPCPITNLSQVLNGAKLYSDATCKTEVAVANVVAGQTYYVAMSSPIIEPENPGNPENPSENPENPIDNPSQGSDKPENPSENPETPENPEPPEETTYTLTISSSTNGSVKTEKTSYKKDDTVEFTVTPGEDYKLDYLRYCDENLQYINIEKNADGKYQIKMPAYDITVSAGFKSIYDPVQSVVFAESELLIATGETVNLEYTVSPETANYEISFVVADAYQKYTNGTIASVAESTNPYVTISDTGAVTADKTGSGKLIFAKVVDKAFETTKYFGPVKVTVKDVATSFNVTTTKINVKAGDKCTINYSMYSYGENSNYTTNVIVKGLKVTNTCTALKFNGLGNQLTTESSIEGDFVSGEITIESDDFPTYIIPVCVYKDTVPNEIKFDKKIVVIKPNETYVPNITISNDDNGVYTPTIEVVNTDVISVTGNTITAKKEGYTVIDARVGNITSSPLKVLVTNSEFIEEDSLYSIDYSGYDQKITGTLSSKKYNISLKDEVEELSVTTLPIITEKDGKKMIEVYVVAENYKDVSVKEDVIIKSSINWLGGGANVYFRNNKAVISVNGKPVKYTISNISNDGAFFVNGKEVDTNASIANTISLPEIVWKDVTLEKGGNKVFTFQINLEELTEKSFDAVIY